LTCPCEIKEIEIRNVILVPHFVWKQLAAENFVRENHTVDDDLNTMSAEHTPE
jgi:hypothetical protein